MVEEFKGEESLQQVVLKNVKTGNLTTYNVDGCFLFIVVDLTSGASPLFWYLLL